MNAAIALPPLYFSQNVWAPEVRGASMSGFCKGRHSAGRT